MSHSCTVCNKSFSTSSNRSRHQNTAHGPGTPCQSSIVINGSSVMQHPFTCIVAGCTKSGKTVWVKSLLENSQKTISPPPQSIIWCYGQWQPSYFDMMRTMPGIEFNQGIPEDIDKADYLDVSQRNLIILDDLNPAKTDVLLIFLRKEVIIEICLSSILSKIYFIRAKK